MGARAESGAERSGAGASPSTSVATGSQHPRSHQAMAVEKSKNERIKYPFWFGGSASGMAACVTHPLDLVKVRLQTRTPTCPPTMSSTILSIIRSPTGPVGLYSGLSASLLRQLTYSTVRFGVYEELKERYTASSGGKSPSALALALLASLSGAIGGLSGNAADIVNVRMQSDASLPPSQRRNYKHALDGMWRMTREEGGLKSWFRGVGPNSVRAAAMTASQLASYDVFKKMILGYTPLEDGLTTHFSASFLAGVVAATVTSPVDVVKTKVMSARGKGRQGVVGLILETTRVEGVGWVFRGWVPSFLRLGPQTICTFICLEAHRKMYRKTVGVGEYGSSGERGSEP